MHQTLYVLAAILTFSILVLGSTRDSVDETSDRGQAEAELRALGAAVSLLDRLSLLPFDAAGEVASPTELTMPAAFGGGGLALGAAASLEQVHGATDTVSVARDGETLPFVVSATVRYVDPVTTTGGLRFVPVGAPTFHKEVEVALSGPLGASVRLRRVYTYAPPAP